MASNASSPIRRTFATLFKIGLYGFIAALIAVVVAVTVAMNSLPSYQELVRRDDLGQMIRVRAADGTVIHAMGPSFGEWLDYEEIPPPELFGCQRAVERLIKTVAQRSKFHANCRRKSTIFVSLGRA